MLLAHGLAGGAVILQKKDRLLPVYEHLHSFQSGIFKPVPAGEGGIAQGNLVRLALRVAPRPQEHEQNHQNDIDQHMLEDDAPAADRSGKLAHAAPPDSPRRAARARTLSACRRQACSTSAREMIA